MALQHSRLRGSVWNQPLLSVVQNHLVAYPTPSNLTGNWNWGVMAGLCLVLQIVTGIFLAMHYAAHVDLAFASVQHMMRDVPNGWLIRYMHANGASLFFIVVYMHLFRGLYYSSYTQPRELVWLVGVVILLVMILTAFIGYVLPWGQMSLWGATVITSLASAIPVVGDHIVQWVWGAHSVDNPTLNRFYSLHYLFPFLLAALSLVHLAALHQYGSTNPLGINAQTDLVDFYPYFYVKDLVAVLGLAAAAAALIGFAPEVLGHTDNNIPANPLQTPAHIQPEFYVLWAYAILRSIPNKLAGVIAMLVAFVALAVLPYLHKPSIRGAPFRSIHQTLVMAWIADFLLLTYLGACPVEDPFVVMGQLATLGFFVLLALICATAHLESYLVQPQTLSVRSFFFFKMPTCYFRGHSAVG